MTATLCQLVHGEPGVGKSGLLQTAPAPRLILDAEGGSRDPIRFMPDGSYIEQRKITWNPLREEPPTAGDWEVCYVAVQEYQVIPKTFAWLNVGKHPFRSVGIDSLTEVQKRCRDFIGGQETLSDRQWGDLLIKMENQVRYYRDLVFHPTHPIEAVTFIALTDTRSGTAKPAIQGGLSISLPGYVDLEGYLYNEQTAEGGTNYNLLIAPYQDPKTRAKYQAKCRKHQLKMRYGQVITNPDIEAMLGVLNEKAQ